MKPQHNQRITRTVRLEALLWRQLTRRAAQASLDAGRRISVNALIRCALVDHLGLGLDPEADLTAHTGRPKV